MKTTLLLSFFICLNFSVFSKNKQTPVNKIELNEISILKVYESNVRDQNSEIEKVNIELDHYKELTESNVSHLETRVNSKIEELDSKYNYYLIFGGLLLAILVFLINYFGRNYIKEKVELLIKKTATEYAVKRTNEVIKAYIDRGEIEKIIKEKGEPAIDEIILGMQKHGRTAIDGIKKKGEKAISSMLAKHEKKIGSEMETTTEEKIINAGKDSRVTEFFDLAFTRKDPLVQIELYKNVLEIEPKNVEALNNIGVSYNNAYNYAEAISYLQKCLEIAPKYALAFANLANSYNLMGDLDKSLEYANKAIELDPKVDYSYSVKGNILTKQEKFNEAEKVFNRAIELKPNSPEAYYTRAFFYEETKKFNEAEKDYQKAEELGFPNKAMLYNNYAVLYRRRQNFDKAIEYLEKARNENPNFPNIDGTLALIYADQKDTDNFYKHLIMALDKGCQAWNYLSDSGFDDYRSDEKLTRLFKSYKKKYIA